MHSPQRAADGRSRAEVCELYGAGVVAVEESIRSWESDDWRQPACGAWNRADTVRHLCAVTTWYHSWLDRAIAGDASTPFQPDEFDVRNQAGVDERQHLSGPDAVAEFQRHAWSYLSRAERNWDLAFGFPLGTITVGHHVGVAAAEWHLHAWDLTLGDPEAHSPHDPEALFLAAGAAVAEAQGGLRGRITARLVPLAAHRSPWHTMLKRSGREPNSAR